MVFISAVEEDTRKRRRRTAEAILVILDVNW